MKKDNISKAKILDKIRQYEKTGEVVATSFLDPSEVAEYQNVFSKVPHYLDGGFEDSERKILVVGKEEKDTLDDYICVLKISSPQKLSHREVLGSILGTGVKRDVVGDIVINDSVANVYILKDISKYLLQNIDRIGREKVKVEKIKIEEALTPVDNSKTINVTLASLRIDAAISACYGLSREISAELIKNSKVKLNYIETTNSSKQIKEGDLISVRGYGRFAILQIVGETRKSRIRVILKKS